MEQIYLDNAATAFPKAPGVAEAMSRCVLECGGNMGRGGYALAAETGLKTLALRERLCRFFGLDAPERVIFTGGQTLSLNMVIRGYVRPGDRVIVSSFEHNSVMRPLNAAGAETVRIPADARGVTEAEAIVPLLRAGARLCVLSHASNVTGAVLPLAELAARCGEYGVPVAVDAAQTAGHMISDFCAPGVSALCVPGHKGLPGPEGIGVMLLQKEFASALSPLITGGTGSASDKELQPERLPDKFESGTLNIPGMYGLAAALEYIEKTGISAIQAHETRLTARFINGACAIPGVRLVGPGPDDNRVGVVSLDFPGLDNALVAERLEREHGVLTRSGLHCAPGAHRALGTFPRGTVRFSFGPMTGEAEVDCCVDALARIILTLG